MQQKAWGRLKDRAAASVIVNARRIDITNGRDAALDYLKAHSMGGHESGEHQSARRILDYATFRYIDGIPKELPLWREQRRLEDAAIARRKLARQFRSQLLEQSRGKCEWCGRPVSGSNATVDHVDPDAGNEIENLAILCRSCNARKKSGGLDRLAGIDAAHKEWAVRSGFKDWESLRGCVRSLVYILEWRHETQSIPQRPDRRTVEDARSATPGSQNRGKATYCRPAGGRQRHCVRSAQRLHVASHAA